MFLGAAASCVQRVRLLQQRAFLRTTSSALKKGGAGGAAAADEAAAGGPSADAVLKQAQERMKAALDAFRRELLGVQGNRVSPQMLDRVMVTGNDGAKVPLLSVAHVSLKQHNTLLVHVFEEKHAKGVESAIREAGLNLNPMRDGSNVTVPVPKMTADFRERLVKMVAQFGEQSKISLRNARHAALDAAKAIEKSAGKDEARRLSKTIQDLIDKHSAEIDSLAERKMKELA